MKSNSQIILLISDIINVDPSQLNDQSDINNVPEWDSLAHMSIIAKLSSIYQFKVTKDLVLGLSSIGKIHDFLKGTKADLED